MKTTLVYAAVGILFILFGVLSLKKTNAKLARCVAPAMGRVVRVDVEYKENERGHRSVESYTPVFEYIVNGASVESPSNVGSTNKNEYKVGDSAEILFNPSKPREFVIKGKSAKSGKGFSFVMMLIGILMIVLGISQM